MYNYRVRHKNRAEEDEPKKKNNRISCMKRQSTIKLLEKWIKFRVLSNEILKIYFNANNNNNNQQSLNGSFKYHKNDIHETKRNKKINELKNNSQLNIYGVLVTEYGTRWWSVLMRQLLLLFSLSQCESAPSVAEDFQFIKAMGERSVIRNK